MDDKGFFGRNRLYYFWMLKKYKERVRLEKLKYWMFQRDMKLYQDQNERRIRTQNLAKRESNDMDRKKLGQ